MNTSWKSIVGVMLIAATIVAAQPREQGNRGGFDQPLSEASQASNVVDLDFSGGSLRDLVGLIREETEDTVNIVLSGPAERIPVEAMVLRGVDVGVVFQIVTDRGFIIANGVPYTARHRAIASRSGASATVHIVQVEDQRGLRAATRQSSSGGAGGILGRAARTEVFALRDVLDAGLAPEMIRSAVDAALALEVDADQPIVQYHEPSKLLLVRGTSDQVLAVQRVVEELRASSAGASRAARGSGAAEEEAVRNRLERAYAQMARVRLEFEEAQRAAVNAGLPGPSAAPEVSQGPAEAQHAIIAARQRVLAAHLGVEQAQGEINRLEQVLTALLVDRHASGSGGDARFAFGRAPVQLPSTADTVPGQPDGDEENR